MKPQQDPSDPGPHRRPMDAGDRLAYAITRGLRFIADLLFAERYDHRTIVLETVAAVPGMVGATLTHLRCLRRAEVDRGWIRCLMDEAENERMHLMTFIQLAQPNAAERLLIIVLQGLFYNLYFLLYLVAPGVAHRVVGYFEEEAVRSYTEYLALIDVGVHANVAAPEIAKQYWQLPEGATLRDVVIAVRADEAGHRDVNHALADDLRGNSAVSVAALAPAVLLEKPR